MAHVSLRHKVYSWALLFLIIIITANHLHCFFAALTVSAGSYFTLPDHQPLQLGVTMATVVSFSAPSFPVGIGPPAVTCRKISTPVRSHTHTQHCTHARTCAEQKYMNIKQKSHRCLYTQSAYSDTAMHNMASLYSSLRKCRQTLSRVQRHTHLYSTLPLASYPWRHTHAKPLKWTPAPRTLCFWSYAGAAGGVGATPFHLHNQTKHYSLTWLFKSFYKGHFSFS